jgi:hypothetical protein
MRNEVVLLFLSPDVGSRLWSHNRMSQFSDNRISMPACNTVNVDRTELERPRSDAVPRHLIFRPRLRVVWIQLLALLGLALGLGAILFLEKATQAPAILGVFGSSVLMALGAYMIWFRRSAPRAIIATDEFLGITHHAGDQQRIAWSSIFSAVHSTKHMGMQWEIDLIPSGRVILRDIGIAPDRWGILRAVIIEFAANHGASISIDSLSESLYSRNL